jgi:hypothetical protein
MKNLDDFCKFLFPNAPVHPDGVDCSYEELKSKTQTILSSLMRKKVFVYFEDTAVLYDVKPIIGGMSKNYLTYDELIPVSQNWIQLNKSINKKFKF